MNRYAYPTSAMVGDYMRSAAGLAPVVALFALTPVGTVGAVILSGFGALFAVFGIRTAVRHGTRLYVSDDGLSASGLWRASIAWDRLDRLKLGYYSTRRDRREGWMQLDLRAGWTTLRLDSRIEGFADLVERAARAAAGRGLQLNEATVANLQALGIDPWRGPDE
jgi:hypothetical protein